MSLYDMTCFQTGGIFGIIDCVNSDSSGVLVNVLLIIVCLVTAGVFLGSGRSVKNVMLLSTMITAFVSLFFRLAAGAAGSVNISLYTSASFVWFVLFAVAMLYHYLSDL